MKKNLGKIIPKKCPECGKTYWGYTHRDDFCAQCWIKARKKVILKTTILKLKKEKK